VSDRKKKGPHVAGFLNTRKGKRGKQNERAHLITNAEKREERLKKARVALRGGEDPKHCRGGKEKKKGKKIPTAIRAMGIQEVS